MRKFDNFKIYLIIGLLVISVILISSLSHIMIYNDSSEFKNNLNYEKNNPGDQNVLLNDLNLNNINNNSIFDVDTKINANANPHIGERIYQLCKECSETPSSMKFSPNNKYFAIGLQNGSIAIFQMSTGEKIRLIHNANSPVKQIVWTFDILIIFLTEYSGDCSFSLHSSQISLAVDAFRSFSIPKNLFSSKWVH